MKVKTYGVPGLTEWHGRVRAGSIEVAVSFTGGTASPSGAQPAYFMTKDPITQFVIENCKEFKSGFIKLYMTGELPGEHPRMAMPKSAPSAEAPEEEEAPASSAAEAVKVADRSEAIEWLKEHYPDKHYTAKALRTASAFNAACEECGVTFDIQ